MSVLSTTDGAATMPTTGKRSQARSRKNTDVTNPEVTLKRYNLAIPEDLFDEVQTLAKKRGTTVVEILRRFITLGLIAAKLDEDPDAELIIRQGDKERQIIFI